MTKIHGFKLPRCEGYMFTDLKGDRLKYASLITARNNAIWYAETKKMKEIIIERYWTEDPFGDKAFIHDFCGILRKDGRAWFWSTDKDCREVNTDGRYKR